MEGLCQGFGASIAYYQEPLPGSVAHAGENDSFYDVMKVHVVNLRG